MFNMRQAGCSLNCQPHQQHLNYSLQVSRWYFSFKDVLCCCYIWTDTSILSSHAPTKSRPRFPKPKPLASSYLSVGTWVLTSNEIALVVW